jgi:hypothetical protein
MAFFREWEAKHLREEPGAHGRFDQESNIR